MKISIGRMKNAKALRRKRQKTLPWERKAEIAERAMRRQDYYLKTVGSYKVAHDFPHNWRVGINAMGIAKVLGASKAEQQQARLAGVTHDVAREDTNLFPHEVAGAKVLKQIMQKRAGKKGLQRAVNAVRYHSKFPGLHSSTVRRAIFFADTAEKLHSYSIFRRAAFQAVKKENINEVTNYIKKKCKETSNFERMSEINKRKLEQLWENEKALYFVKDRTEVMIKEYGKLENFPVELRKGLERQILLQKHFLKALDRRESWAENMALTMYWSGKRGGSVDDSVRKYSPIGRRDMLFKREAIRFIDGNFFR